VIAIESGKLPTATVVTTVLVAVSTTETVLLLAFATYRSVLSGVRATLAGLLPTEMVAVIVLVAVSITETVELFSFATYALIDVCAETACDSAAVPMLDEQAPAPSAVTSNTSADRRRVPANNLVATFFLRTLIA
jgi:hypothetical protein